MRRTKRQDEAALARARQERDEVRKAGARRDRLVDRLEQHGKINHIAERFERALRQRRAPQ